MAGIYFHIPFCKQACYYCDFHFSTNNTYRDEMIILMGKELELQAAYLSEPIETIYFGGGTPSLLAPAQIEFLLNKTHQLFHVSGPEITLEANPDDLQQDTLHDLLSLGINRLSIGIQSFDDNILKSLNRAHDAGTAEMCVKLAQDAGFGNISIDLIYAIPGQTDEQWLGNIGKAIRLSPVHISSYSLTIEDKTAFGRWASKGRFTPVPDDNAATQLMLLVTELERAGFEQYEVSNFALPGFYSRHNSSYWRQLPYLGIGPSAHSYNISSRQHNVSNNHGYMNSIRGRNIPATIEVLTREERINDYLLTTLRTSWGADLNKLASELDYDLLKNHGGYVRQLIGAGHAEITEGILVLTRTGRFLADKISADLFAVAGD